MTQEEKQLLLVDLCARFPYGVKVQHQRQDYLDEIQTIEHISRQYGEIETESVLGFVDDFKPYLRSMSSMTDVEKYIFDAMTRGYTIHQQATLFDWLNAHHFDFRNLVERGLAIEAPKGMYEEEQQ
jgi:hypothetical protein